MGYVIKIYRHNRTLEVTLQVCSLLDSSLPPAVRKKLVLSVSCTGAGGAARIQYNSESPQGTRSPEELQSGEIYASTIDGL